MKIAYFIGTLRKEDGVTQVLLNLVDYIYRRGHKAMIVTGWAEDESQFPIPVLEIPAIVVPVYKDYRVPFPGMYNFAEEMDNFKPDIIHLHSPDAVAWAALKYAQDRGIPIIITHHTDFASYLKYYHVDLLKPVLWRLLRSLYNRMDLVTATSSVSARDLKYHGIKRVESIHWGVDFTRFNPKFRSEAWRHKILSGKHKGKTILICVCRLTWEKDLQTLSDAYNILLKKRNDFVMVVVGDGPQRKELQEMMPGAIFTGHLEGKALSQAYASADILLFPSTTETFGNVTIEAMAAGLIPVVADAGGSKALVKSGKTGYLSKPKDPADAADKVNKLLDDPGLQAKMKVEIAGYVKEFAWDNVCDRMLKHYFSLVEHYKHKRKKLK